MRIRKLIPIFVEDKIINSYNNQVLHANKVKTEWNGLKLNHVDSIDVDTLITHYKPPESVCL